tara:strand:+ start:1056 stop:2888 length:1833 start_codon:yes stop_codon:yes gene_type:complete
MAFADTDFTLPRDAYATFDALTLKKLIKQRLTQGGVFTDQDFEGSNISSIIDIIAFSYHLSIFYLNQTASEALFDEATLFENINRVTKLIGYNPTGYKTSVLSFNATAGELLPINIYTIKRFSYFTINGVDFSFIKDTTFSKTNSLTEILTTLSEQNLLYQGKYFEHPTQVAIGEDYETISLIVKDTVNKKAVNIEHDSLNVFVKKFNDDKFIEFTEVDSIFTQDSSTYAYEKRLNENGFYELKFGNNVNGVKLTAGDSVYIYYLKSDGSKGLIASNTLNGNNINIFTSTQFESISKYIYDKDTLFFTPSLATNVSFTNDYGSTAPAEIETVDQIKQNSPKTFFAQHRLVTTHDIDTFINKTYSNIVASSKTVNNSSYIDNVIKYYYDLGLDRPNDDPRFLFNQVKFATTSQLNTIHAFMVPRLRTVDSSNNPFFLTSSQKSEILNSMADTKMANIEIVPQDPIYNAITVGLQDTSSAPKVDDITDSFLVIRRQINERFSATKIKENVNNIFKNTFATGTAKLGQVINLSDIAAQILNIPGVQGIITRRVNKTGQVIREVPFLNIYSFNSVYSDVDIESTSSNITLPYFKYPFLYNTTLSERIIIETVDT